MADLHLKLLPRTGLALLGAAAITLSATADSASRGAELLQPFKQQMMGALKAGLAEAVLAAYDATASPFEQWRHILTTSYAFLAEEPERARFLSQLEESPYYEEAHARLAEAGRNPCSAVASAVRSLWLCERCF